jgi:hypothetical protein
MYYAYPKTAICCRGREFARALGKAVTFIRIT